MDAASGVMDARRMANAIRALSMDAVEKAKSRPSRPAAWAPPTSPRCCSRDVLKFDAADPHWPDRDRFVLSAGHGSMLLYSLLYLTGYRGDDDRRDQAVPPVRLARRPAIPNTAIRSASRPRPVRSARASPTRSAWRSPSACSPTFRRRSRRPSHLCVRRRRLPDGGHFPRGRPWRAPGLDRLIVLFDDNGISIDGPTSLATSEYQQARFEACGWHWQATDGHDPEKIAQRSRRPSRRIARASLPAAR